MLRIADALLSFTVGNFVYTSHNNVLWLKCCSVQVLLTEWGTRGAAKNEIAMDTMSYCRFLSFRSAILPSCLRLLCTECTMTSIQAPTTQATIKVTVTTISQNGILNAMISTLASASPISDSYETPISTTAINTTSTAQTVNATERRTM